MKQTKHTRQTIHSLLRFCLPTLLCLLLLSCSSDTEQSEGTDVLLDIRAGGTYGVPDNGTPQERILNRIRIYVFFANTGILDKMLYQQDNAPGGFPSLPVLLNNVLIKSGNKTFVVVGNEPASMKAALDAVTKYSELTPLLLTDETTYNQAGAVMPFSWEKQMNISPTHVGNIDMGLQRSLGKVQMQIAKDPENLKTVYIKSAQLIRTPKKSSLLAAHRLDATLPGMLTSLTAEAYPANTEVVATAGQERTMNPKYLYEHHRGTGAAAAAGATALKLELEIGGVQRSFEIPLVSSIENGKPIYAVKRNLISNLKIRVMGEHLKVDYLMMPWNEEEYIKNPSEDDTNVQFTDWIEEVDYDHTLPEYP